MNTNDFFKEDNLTDQVFYFALTLRTSLLDIGTLLDFIRKLEHTKIIYRRTAPTYLYIWDTPPTTEAKKE